MARTEEEIRSSLSESVKANDPSVDTVKGPIYDWMLKPVPPELQKTEADAERLTILTTHQFDRVATEAEIRSLATSFSIRLGGGKSSKVRKGQQFYAYTKPTTEDLVISRGTLVGTIDSQYTYLTTEEVSIPVDQADNYYNPQTRRYEVLADAEATAVGPSFDLPSTRVNRILIGIDGIDGTTNIKDYEGGEEEEDLTNSIDRIRAKFAGLDPETGGGILSDIRNYDSETITDVVLVYPKDRDLFKRGLNRPAIDAYVKGELLETVEETYVASGGETQIPITYQPVREIVKVRVNNVEVSATLIKDETRQTGGSPRATDYVLLDSALSLADTVIIEYTYNSLLYDMQDDVFSAERPFDTDVLVREPWEVPLVIEIDAVAIASADTARLYTSILSSLTSQVESDFFVDVLEPEVIRQNIRSAVGGLTMIRMVKFKRLYGSTLEVETVDLKKNEDPSIDQAQLVINVRR